MKNVYFVVLSVTLLLGLCACGSQKPEDAANSDSSSTWQEQYDLGIRYLEDGNYEEAIIAFTAAIEIDPKQAPAYIGRGDAYMSLQEYDSAEQDFNKALELDPSLDISERFDAIETGRNALLLVMLKESLRPIIEQLNISFTVDAITLGESHLVVAKNAYLGRPYALSNLMNDDTCDTVYTCFGMNDTPIPTGYDELDFGFFFGAPADGGGIDQIVIADPDFTCLGSLRIGDDGVTALNYFGFPENAPIGELKWELTSGAVLSYSGANSEEYSFRYQLDNRWTEVDIVGGDIHRIFLTEEH